MTIKNKKTKQSKASEVTSSTSASTSSASTSVQKSSTTTSNIVQKVSSSGKKVRYIEVKVEPDDPLMITDISDHASVSGSTVSEHYNSHPHYIITEAPSITDLSQSRSHEHHVSDMALATSGEFVSNSMQESSTSHQQSSKSESFQTSSTSVEKSGSSHSQTFDRTMDSAVGNQTLNTGFIDNSATNASGSNTAFLTRSQGAHATDSFLQSERQDIMNKQSVQQSSSKEVVNESSTSSDQKNKNINQRKNVTYQNSPQPSQRGQTVKSDTSNFYGGEGSLDKNAQTKHFTSTSQSNESKSSSVMKSSSSSYVVEIVDGKERIIDSSKREWGDAQEHASKEAYASMSGTNIKPQSAYSAQNYDMKSKYDTGKDGSKPSSEMLVKEDSKYIKDGNQVTSHSHVIKEKDNSIQQQYTSTQEQLASKDHSHIGHGQVLTDVHQLQPGSTQKHLSSTDQQYSNTSKDHVTSSSQNYSTTTSSNTNTTETNKNTIHSADRTMQDRRRDPNKTDSSNFYGYDTTIQNELRKVGDILNVGNTENFNFSTKILKSNTSSAQQASTSSYRVEVIDGKERIIDTSHREWGDSKDHGTFEKSHNISGTGIKPEHEYTRHVLDKESHYDSGKNGIPTSSTQIAEESVLYKDGKEIAYTSNIYDGGFTKKNAITEHIPDSDDVHNRRIPDKTDKSSYSTTQQTTSSDQSNIKDSKSFTETTDVLTTEKTNLSKESSQTKDTLTTYERSTGAWNGKFTYEKDDDRPKRPKQMSPFGKPEQPKHHLKRQDTEENIILSSRDINDFTSISDLRKIIESSQSRKDVTVSDKSIIIRRNIDDRVLKDIIETVKKYPFKKIEKVTFGTRINEDVKDLYEGVDTEQTTVINTSSSDITKKSFEVQKTRSQVEVTRYITENGVTRKITTYEEPKEDDKVKTNVFVDKSGLDVTNLVSNQSSNYIF